MAGEVGKVVPRRLQPSQRNEEESCEENTGNRANRCASLHPDGGYIMADRAEYRCDEAALGEMTEVPLNFCPTGETVAGFVQVSPRMKNLALMGFHPVALVRANPADLCEFSIYALPDLPGSIVYAISRESERLVLDALVAVKKDARATSEDSISRLWAANNRSNCVGRWRKGN